MTLASNQPPTWDTLLSTTLNNYRKTLTDNIFGGRVMLNYLMEKGRVRVLDGGIYIIEPLLIGPGEADSYGAWQKIDVNHVEGITSAVYQWRQIYATILIGGLEEAQNNGKEQMINLLEAKVMQAEETLKSILSKMLWGTRGTAAKSTDFTPFTTLIDSVAPAGGIDPGATGGPGTNTTPENRWRSPSVNAGTGAGFDALGNPITIAPITDGASLEKGLQTMYMAASDGGTDHVDAIFAAGDVYAAYETSLTPQVRYTDTSKANLGFQNLMYKQIPLYWDPDAPAGSALGTNSKYIGLAIHSERNFAQSPFTGNLGSGLTNTGAQGTPAAPSATQYSIPGAPAANLLDARLSVITTYGNTTCRERRRNFKITGAVFAP